MAERFGNDLVLLERLAAGGMAEVYRGKQLGYAGFEKTIAIKRILPNYASNEEFKAMFREEANLSGLLQHQNIVQIFGNGEFNDYLYLTMEFVDGKNVRQVLARADKKKIRIPVEFALYIVSEAAKGLDYAHNFADEKTGEPLEIVHRDMSPQNIMLSYDGAVKIVDFGIAKAAARSGQTKAGVLKGKFGYMSPEQAQGMPLDRRTDVFALGIILFELLTQRRLFTSDDDLRTLQLVKDCRVPRPSKYNPDVSQSLDAIVLKALKKEKAERYESGNELYVDLIRYLNQKYPRFLPTDLSKFLREVFAEDIIEEKKKRDKANSEMPTREELSKTSGASQVALPLSTAAANVVNESQSDRTNVSGVTNPTESSVALPEPSDRLATSKESVREAPKLREVQSLPDPVEDVTNKTPIDSDSTQLYEKEESLALRKDSLAQNPYSKPIGIIPPATSLPPPKSSSDSEALRKQLLMKAQLHKKTQRPSPVTKRKLGPGAWVAALLLLVMGVYKTMLMEDAQQPNREVSNQCDEPLVWNPQTMSCGMKVEQVQTNPPSQDSTQRSTQEATQETPKITPVCAVDELVHPDQGICVKAASLCKQNQNWDPQLRTCVNTKAPDQDDVWVLSLDNFVPSGVLKLRSTPQADFISINGKQLVSKDRLPLKTPIPEIRLKPGTYRIRVKNDFFGMSKEENVTIEADRIVDLDLLMK